jgi:serine/threonine-protein kinase
MPLDPHARLGPYEILVQIGEGGMGEVYRARDTRLGRDVALKVVRTEFSARFQTEARAIAALNHPNICTLFDVGPNYLVMEFVEGETLAERLKQGALAAAEAVRMAIMIADALGGAHAKSITHRDLKPGNVMVTADGRAKLLDFGLAKMLDLSDPDATRTVDGAVMGTFAYMSPEQLAGKPAGPSSDIFTFGAVLYEMLTARHAFQAAASRDEMPSLSGIPEGLAGIISRCLRFKPEERYATMGDVKSALELAKIQLAEPVASIAVLPFADLSADKDNEYFSDGLAEEILNSLSRIEGLKVAARTSAFSFRGEKADIRVIGEKLGVRTVLEGSVRRAGNRIRVTTQLIKIADGYHLWSERYDRDMTDIFAVQDEISAAIVEALKVKLVAKAPAPKRPVNMDAYHALLKGRHRMWKITPEDYAAATVHYETAISLDPHYALAHAALAECFFLMGQTGATREMLPRARAAALKALDLDESLPEAHAVLAAVAATFDYDWKEAATRFERARAANDIQIRSLCCNMVLPPLGRFREMMQIAEQAIAADPLAPLPRSTLAVALIGMGSYERAEEELLQLLDLHGQFIPAYMSLYVAYFVRGMIQEALAITERGVAQIPWFPPLLGALAGLYRRSGNDAQADGMLGRLDSMGGNVMVDAARALYYALIQDYEHAADYYERLMEARHFMVTNLSWNPIAREFRETPRGRALLAKMHLAEVSTSRVG